MNTPKSIMVLPEAYHAEAELSIFRTMGRECHARLTGGATISSEVAALASQTLAGKSQQRPASPILSAKDPWGFGCRLRGAA
jgi:hypothetical protein